MASLFKDMQRVLNEREPPRRFTDVNDEKKGKLCDPQTPFHEWDDVSLTLLKEKIPNGVFFPLILPLYNLAGNGHCIPRWNVYEVCSELDFKFQTLKLCRYEILDEGFRCADSFRDLPKNIHKWLLRDTWSDPTRLYGTFLDELQSLILDLESCLHLMYEIIPSTLTD